MVDAPSAIPITSSRVASYGHKLDYLVPCIIRYSEIMSYPVLLQNNITRFNTDILISRKWFSVGRDRIPHAIISREHNSSLLVSIYVAKRFAKWCQKLSGKLLWCSYCNHCELVLVLTRSTFDRKSSSSAWRFLRVRALSERKRNYVLFPKRRKRLWVQIEFKHAASDWMIS